MASLEERKESKVTYDFVSQDSDLPFALRRY